MRIAAIQHRLCDDADGDARALAQAALAAAGQGAELIVFPSVPSLHLDSGAGHMLLTELVADVSATCIIPDVAMASRGAAAVIALPEPFSAPGLPTCMAGILVGDACMDRASVGEVASRRPSLAVLSPRSETDLQAEAVLEYAIALSYSLAGLMIVAECAGAEPLEAGHGGSAIVLLGDVVAEALADDGILIADVQLPLPEPQPREPLPPVPPLLTQRVAHHAGRIAVEHGADVS
jgi:predicted amidohydrolase